MNKEEYNSPEMEILLTSRINLMLDMSAELPEGMEEGDQDTFGPATPIGD